MLHKAASTQDEEEEEGRIPGWGDWTKSEELRAKNHLEYTTFPDSTKTRMEAHDQVPVYLKKLRAKNNLEYTTFQRAFWTKRVEDKAPSESSSISLSTDSDKHPRASTDRVDWMKKTELASQASKRVRIRASIFPQACCACHCFGLVLGRLSSRHR